MKGQLAVEAFSGNFDGCFLFFPDSGSDINYYTDICNFGCVSRLSSIGDKEKNRDDDQQGKEVAKFYNYKVTGKERKTHFGI